MGDAHPSMDGRRLLPFASGIVMMYARFPPVEAEERLSRAGRIDPSQIRIGPAEALSALHSSTAPYQLRLALLDGPSGLSFCFWTAHRYCIRG